VEPFDRLLIYLLGPRWLLGSLCFNTNGRQSSDINRFLLQIVGRRGAAVQIEGMGLDPSILRAGAFIVKAMQLFAPTDETASPVSDRRDRVTCEGKRRTIEFVV
jgi:hypothetical protein